MKVMFNVAHPAHVHLFRNVINLLQRRGHDIEIVALGREITEQLLRIYGLQYMSLGRSHKDLLVKYVDTVRADLRMVRLIKRSRPDILVSTGIPYSAQAAKVCGIPSIAFSDTEIATLVLQATLPFVSAVCTPSCFDSDLGPKQIKYDGYHELAYLHPNYFSPDPSVLDHLGLSKDEDFFVIRLSSADSSHDLGPKMSLLDDVRSAMEILRELEQLGRVFLSSEVQLPGNLRRYETGIPPHKMHDLLAHAAIYLGEGATMASEAGVLGVPWIYVSPTTRGYLKDQEENYGLGFSVGSWESAEEKASQLAQNENLRSDWQSKREALLADKIDVTQFIADFIVNWPNSFTEYSGRG